MSATTTRGARPQALAVLVENIPDLLKQNATWVGWRYVHDVDEETGEVNWDKPPLNARTGGLASSTNPVTWSDFPTAVQALRERKWDGIGFVLRRKADDTGAVFVAIDLDDCRDPDTGKLAEWAQQIIDAIGSYTEVSPSGRGVRIFPAGTAPAQWPEEGALRELRHRPLCDRDWAARARDAAHDRAPARGARTGPRKHLAASGVAAAQRAPWGRYPCQRGRCGDRSPRVLGSEDGAEVLGALGRRHQRLPKPIRGRSWPVQLPGLLVRAGRKPDC
ncbi:MAG TPA: hypothetical protein VEL76_00715 [Gemmataceae bacterium]|nr:hypothetical protein [Gemmataceae bacterium]